MIRLYRALVWAFLAVLFSQDAAMAAVVQITVKDAGGTTRNVNVTTNTDLTGNLVWNNVICDQAAGTTCASVGTAGSPSTNALTIQAVTIGHGTAANAIRVELPTDGTGIANLATGGTAAASACTAALNGFSTSTPATICTVVGSYVLNTNANGSAVSALSSPVVIASDQVAVAIKAASGGFASGAIASGALASGSVASGAYASGSIGSGAIASGAVASGAYASGSIGSGAIAANAYASGAVPSGAYSSGALASGAVVDITNMSVATGAAPPSKAIYLGANASGATGGFVRGLINCDSHVFKHITSATDTVAVQGVASQTIYVCGWRSRAAGVATWFLENTASANNNCSSSNTQLTGVATEAANTGEVRVSPFWDGLKTTSGNGLCINSTGTGGVDVDVWYTQF